MIFSDKKSISMKQKLLKNGTNIFNVFIPPSQQLTA